MGGCGFHRAYTVGLDRTNYGDTRSGTAWWVSAAADRAALHPQAIDRRARGHVRAIAGDMRFVAFTDIGIPPPRAAGAFAWP